MKTKKTKSKKPAATAKKTVAKRATAKKPCAKTTAKKPARTTSKAPAKAARTPAKRSDTPEIFKGATEVSLTQNKIIVTKMKSKNVNGRYEKKEVREYHDKTPANMNALNRQLVNVEPKKVSVKFK